MSETPYYKLVASFSFLPAGYVLSWKLFSVGRHHTCLCRFHSQSASHDCVYFVSCYLELI